MYFHPRYTASVRDGQAHYPPAPPDPFPASRVLDDLRHAPGPDAPRIVARYTALRCWTLTAEGAEPALVDHALSAAREHLAAVSGGWSEGALLEELLEAGPDVAAALLDAAAAAAASAGHRAGSRSLLIAAAHARSVRDPGPPAPP